MKKFTLMTLVTLLVLVFTGSMTFAATSTVTVTLKDTQLVENSHVGNDWSTTAKIGKKEVNIGDSVTVNSKTALKLFAEALENDKYPDVGTKSKSITPSKYIGKDVVLKVVVTENRGRYAGNSAVWEFTYSVAQ